MPEIEIRVESSQQKGEWIVFWQKPQLPLAKIIEKLRKSKCFKQIEGNAEQLRVIPEKGKEHYAMLEIMNHINPNLVSAETNLSSIINNARILWYEDD